MSDSGQERVCERCRLPEQGEGPEAVVRAYCQCGPIWQGVKESVRKGIETPLDPEAVYRKRAVGEDVRSYPLSYYGWACDHCGKELVWDKATSAETLEVARAGWQKHRRECPSPSEERLVRAMAGMLANQSRRFLTPEELAAGVNSRGGLLETDEMYAARLTAAGLAALKEVRK